MGKDTQEQGNGLPEIGLTLDDLIRRGARQVIHHVIEAELAQLLEQYEHVTTVQGHRAVVRNGYLPERDVLTGVGPVAVKVPSKTPAISASSTCTSPLKTPEWLMANSWHCKSWLSMVPSMTMRSASVTLP